MTDFTVLDRLVAVHLDVRIWSGRKKLTAEDLSLGAEVPPEDLVSLGSKRICDPEAIRVFHRLKHQAERLCLAGGVRFLGGFAIPEERAEAVAAGLDTLGEAFVAARRAFVADYGQVIEAWIARHPEWEAAIRRAVEPATRVAGRFDFRYQLIRVAPAPVSGDLEAAVEGLGDTLFAEVAEIARSLGESFVGKDALSQRALATFRRIREKLGCLAFVDYRVQPVLETVEDWLARVPRSGPVTGALFNEGFGLMLLVSDAERMGAHGAGLLALHELIPAVAAPPAPEPATEDERDDDRDGDLTWSFGGPLGDEEPQDPDEAAEAETPLPIPPMSGPVEAESFYF
jgi:hypothetical protein